MDCLENEEIRQRISDDDVGIPGFTEETLVDLTEELGCTRRDIDELYETFVAVAGAKDTIPISELKEFLMRRSADGPTDGSGIEACLNLKDEDGEGSITFVEYLRARWNSECKIS
jgi:Ca2+-binding EF-hand superfamily protein